MQGRSAWDGQSIGQPHPGPDGVPKTDRCSDPKMLGLFSRRDLEVDKLLEVFTRERYIL